MPPVWFTPHSALEALVRARPLAATLCRLYATLERRHRAEKSSDRRVDPVYFRTLIEYEICRHELRRLGASVRDAKQGLFGFRARREGRPVWLCWRVGERAPRFWLEGDAGPPTGPLEAGIGPPKE